MANVSLRVLSKNIAAYLNIRLGAIRHGHHMRGKPPTVARTLKDRLKLLDNTDPTVSFKVNIGFTPSKISLDKKQHWMSEHKRKRMDPQFQKQVRTGEHSIDLEEANRIWQKTNMPRQVHRIAQHYGIFQDLFGDAFFLPVLPLSIRFKVEEETLVRVHTGNVVKPSEAREMPEVEYEADKDSLWTLTMCTPDGHLEDPNKEYCHWFLGNIPEHKIEQGEQIIDYLAPMPARGAGYYRYVFVLYKQTRRLNYAELKRGQPCLRLAERTWSTLDFYRKYQNDLTPAGLAFFQSDWDPAVKELYHFALDAKEPVFQYDFPKPYVRPQKWFPLKQPFNIYLDRYKDPRDVMKEYLTKKLKTVHPFEEPTPPLKYPNACSIDQRLPSWLKEEMKKERLGFGRVNDIK